MSEGFFSRWSRRKQELAHRAPDTPASPAPPALDQALVSAPAPSQMPAPPSRSAGPAAPEHDTAQPLPTLEDAQQLTPQSDFQPFMQRGVVPEVRNAAMKKLFADPHFNVMDGLDIYIDDYNKPDPMPAGMLRKMASAQFLKLVPEPQSQDAERRAQDPDGLLPPQPVPEVVAHSPDSPAPVEPPHHDHPDLQLQPDPAPADPSPGSRSG
jgi:hypothetical protein